VSKRGVSPSSQNLPLPLAKGKGIQGKGLINELIYGIISTVDGDIAQLGERCVRIAEAGGSNPPIST
jgi:hypothetical protein